MPGDDERGGISGRSKGKATVVDASVVSLLVGCLLFAISLFQPSVIVGWLDGNDVLLGYHALLGSPGLIMAVVLGGSDSVFHILVGILAPICNLYVFASYWLYRYYKRSRDNTLLLGAAVFAAAAWSYPAHAERFPPIAGMGYYLWASSITFISLSLLLLAVTGKKS